MKQTNKDIVFIEQLEVATTIGVYEWEQQIKQKLVLDLHMAYDTQAAGNSDNLTDALNYAAVSEAVINLVENGKFLLVERVAEEVAHLVLSAFAVSWVRVKVTKPTAVLQAKGVGVVIERGQA